MIVEQVLAAKKAKIKQWPVNANQASQLGHECLRYLVLHRTRWQEKTLHDARLQMIFDMGQTIEDATYRDLREAGITIVEQQRPFAWPKYQITGKIDCKLAINGGVYPCEIKSAAPHPFESINSIEDMLRHKYPYMRRYPAQLCLYMLMDNKDKGLFLFKQKSTGELKEVWMELDYTFAESLVQKAEAINAHVAAGTLPEPMEYQDNVCSECPYAHICMPDRIGTEVDVVDDTELLELLSEHETLKPGAKRYDEVDKRITELVTGREKVLAGDFFVEGRWQQRKSYQVPDDVKAQYETITQFWRKNIMRVDGK